MTKSTVVFTHKLNCFNLRRIAVTLVYYGLTISATDIAGDKYLNFSLASFVEIPACLLNWLIMEGMSRRMSLSCMLILSGLSSVLYNLVPNCKYTYEPKLKVETLFLPKILFYTLWLNKRSTDYRPLVYTLYIDLVGVKYLDHIRSIRGYILSWYLRLPLTSK